MSAVVLDSSAVSAIMSRLPIALERLTAEVPVEVLLTAPAAAEIQYGLVRLPAGCRRRRLLEGEYERLRRAVTWVDWTEEAAIEFGHQKAFLAAAGTPIEDFDIAIGALAVVHGARLATLNVRHFERLDGVEVEGWG